MTVSRLPGGAASAASMGCRGSAAEPGQSSASGDTDTINLAVSVPLRRDRAALSPADIGQHTPHRTAHWSSRCSTGQGCTLSTFLGCTGLGSATRLRFESTFVSEGAPEPAGGNSASRQPMAPHLRMCPPDASPMQLVFQSSFNTPSPSVEIMTRRPKENTIHGIRVVSRRLYNLTKCSTADSASLRRGTLTLSAMSASGDTAQRASTGHSHCRAGNVLQVKTMT